MSMSVPNSSMLIHTNCFHSFFFHFNFSFVWCDPMATNLVYTVYIFLLVFAVFSLLLLYAVLFLGCRSEIVLENKILCWILFNDFQMIDFLIMSNAAKFLFICIEKSYFCCLWMKKCDLEKWRKYWKIQNCVTCTLLLD